MIRLFIAQLASIALLLCQPCTAAADERSDREIADAVGSLVQASQADYLPLKRQHLAALHERQEVLAHWATTASEPLLRLMAHILCEGMSRPDAIGRLNRSVPVPAAERVWILGVQQNGRALAEHFRETPLVLVEVMWKRSLPEGWRERGWDPFAAQAASVLAAGVLRLETARPLLEAGLGSPSYGVRCTSAMALAELGAHQSLPALFARLEESPGEMEDYAILDVMGAARSGVTGADIPFLEAQLATTRREHVRQFISRVLPSLKEKTRP